MLGIRVLGRRRLFSTLLSLFMASFLSSTLFAISLAYLCSFDVALRGGVDGVVVLEGGSRSVFTSHVPLSLWESLRRHPEVSECEVFTLTPVQAGSRAVVVRGVRRELLATEYAGHLLQGVVPGPEGPWALAGVKAAERLGLELGHDLVLASPLRPDLIHAQVVGIYSFGDHRDYELAVPLPLGQRLAGLPKNTASVIVVRGLSKARLDELLNGRFVLKVSCHIDVGGWVLVLDPLNALVASGRVEGPSTINFTLPFGYYTVAYQGPNFFSTLGEVLLTSDRTMDIGFSLEEPVVLKVVAPREAPVSLSNGSGPLEGSWADGYWTFVVEPGLYTLSVGNETYELPVFGDLVFNPQGLVGGFELTVEVRSWDGGKVEGSLLVIENEEGEVVASLADCPPDVVVRLPEGTYTIRVFKAPYFVSRTVRVPEETAVVVELPRLISNPEKVPCRFYPALRPLASKEASSYAFYAFVGLSASYLLALEGVLLVLAALTCLAVHRHLYMSIRGELRVLRLLGFSWPRLLYHLGLPHLLLLAVSLALGLSAAWTFYVLASLDEVLTVLGYGSPFPPVKVLALTAISMLASWASSFAWGIRRASSE